MTNDSSSFIRFINNVMIDKKQKAKYTTNKFRDIC